MMFYVENLHTKERGDRRFRTAEIGSPRADAGWFSGAQETSPGSTTSQGVRWASR